MSMLFTAVDVFRVSLYSVFTVIVVEVYLLCGSLNLWPIVYVAIIIRHGCKNESTNLPKICTKGDIAETFLYDLLLEFIKRKI